MLFFAVNNWRPWTHASPNQVNITIDVGMNGTDDYLVRMTDFGLATAAAFDGQTAVAVFNLRTGAGHLSFLASAPTNSSTMLLPVRIQSGLAAATARQLCLGGGADCLSAANPRFSYRVSTVGLRLTTENDTVPGVAGYNAWSSSISQGAFVPLAPNQSVDVPISVNMAEWAHDSGEGRHGRFARQQERPGRGTDDRGQGRLATRPSLSEDKGPRRSGAGGLFCHVVGRPCCARNPAPCSRAAATG